MTEQVYDNIAGTYDRLYLEPRHLLENRTVFTALRGHANGTVLDVGCGTGILLDYLPVPPDKYVGIDPSAQMLAVFSGKHPEHTVWQETFQEWRANNLDFTADLSVALFGTGSYIPPDHYEALARSGRRYFFMFYRRGYRPGYEPEGLTLTDYDRLSVFGPVQEWSNYLVATNTGEVLL